jgi:hypothetical protein
LREWREAWCGPIILDVDGIRRTTNVTHGQDYCSAKDDDNDDDSKLDKESGPIVFDGDGILVRRKTNDDGGRGRVRSWMGRR